MEEYSQLPGTITAHLSTLVPELTKVFDSLPLTLDKPTKPPTMSYTFNESTKVYKKVNLEKRLLYPVIRRVYL